MTTNNIPPRWYMIARDGIAMLCASEQDALAEAAKADQAWPNNAPHVPVQLAPVQSAMPADAEDDEGMPVGYAAWYCRQFGGQVVDTQRDHHCESAWRAALAYARRRIEGAGHANS